MQDYFDLSRLPLLSPSRQTLQVSSFDRKGENADFEQFLYQDADGSMVMFDDKGKGCIKSIWSAIVTDESLLSFYFDGSDVPRFTVTLKGLFTGEEPLLTGAGVSFERTGWGHFDPDQCRAGNCMIPIPYEKGLKITLKGKTDIYYHIMYEKYDADYDMALCDGERSDAFYDAFAGKRTVAKKETYEKNLTLSNMYTHVFTADVPGVITEFTVEADETTDLSRIWMDIVWDGELMSQVSTPLLNLFAMPFGFTEIQTHAVSTKKENGKMILSFYLPMPYWSAADITFVNRAEDPAADPVNLTLKLSIAENHYDKKETGTFCADYRQGVTELFGDWLIGEYFGRGNIVGVVQTCHGGQYCEGNEHFYIDGAMTPQINGTGTEDFYLGCYWPNTKYDFPCAGCVNDVYTMNDSTVKGAFKYPSGYYRFLHDMPIAFSDGIKLCIQHGAVGQTYSDYSTLCLSYRQDLPELIQTDRIQTGNEASREMHAYRAENAESVSLCGKVEMERRAKILAKKGLVHKAGKISFTVAVEPENQGVWLRRVYDQTLSPQGGRVFADGIPVGEWYNPGKNPTTPFADSDFRIPASVTKGKTKLTIEIDVEKIYSDFEYTVFSVVNPAEFPSGTAMQKGMTE